MPGEIDVLTQATLQNWRHLTAIARSWTHTPGLDGDRLVAAARRIAAASPFAGNRGGTAGDTALFAGQQAAGYDRLAPGSLGRFVVGTRMSQAAAEVLAPLASGREAEYRKRVGLIDLAGNADVLVEVLVTLAAYAATADPTGANPPYVILDATDPGPWSANPARIPTIRRQMAAHMASDQAAYAWAASVAEETGADAETALEAGRWYAELEAARLRQARLYHADADTVAVAVRKATRARKSPLSAGRIPGGAGFIVFDVPVESAPHLAPIVAASWSPLDPQMAEAMDFQDDPDGPGGVRRWWITFYSQEFQGDEMPPLRWRGQFHVAEGRRFGEPEPGTTALAMRTVVACWDLITQELVGKPVTEVEHVTRKPTKVRADRRAGIADDGTVRLVTIRGRRPAAVVRPRDGETPTAGPSRRYDRGRWHVEEHSRDHCMNPHAHASGGCTHEDITILDYVKGPEGAPFLDTVRLLRARDGEQE